jgi:hypothetical protein
MGIVEDGPCQLISRTGREGMEVLFPEEVNTGSCFGPRQWTCRNPGRNLSQGSKRVCKLLGESVLERRQTGVEIREVVI